MMLRLTRLMFGLIVMNVAGIVLVIATRYSDDIWGCLKYIDMNNRDAMLDVKHGAYFTENGVRVNNSNPIAVRFHDMLLYEYFSVSNVHRIGTVTRTTMPYLDFAESPDFIVRTEPLSSDYNYLPITTYDRATRTQTVTVYDVRTLTPLVSSVQTDVALARAPQGNYERTPVGWSPKGNWFAIISLRAGNVEVTLLSPTRKLVRSFPLVGSLNDSSFVWSVTDRALAVATDGDYLANLLVAEDDDWNNVKTYELRASNADALLNFGYWSVDDRSFYFVEPWLATGSASEFVFNAFRVETQRIEPADDEQIDWPSMRLANTWMCKRDTTPSSLISMTTDHDPILLADFDLDSGLCPPAMQSPDGTKVVVGTHSAPDAPIEWVGLTAEPFSITPLSLPAATRQVVGWSADSRLALLFVPDPQTVNDDDGKLAILDTTTWQWTLTNAAISIDQYADVYMTQGISPDASRLLVMTADGQESLMLDAQGKIVGKLDIPVSYPYINVNWSPDSTRFMLTDYRVQAPLSLYVFDRDAQLLRGMHFPPQFERWNINTETRGWTTCEPSVKLPPIDLP